MIISNSARDVDPNLATFLRSRQHDQVSWSQACRGTGLGEVWHPNCTLLAEHKYLMTHCYITLVWSTYSSTCSTTFTHILMAAIIQGAMTRDAAALTGSLQCHSNRKEKPAFASWGSLSSQDPLKLITNQTSRVTATITCVIDVNEVSTAACGCFLPLAYSQNSLDYQCLRHPHPFVPLSRWPLKCSNRVMWEK